jgi:hypothetical protein
MPSLKAVAAAAMLAATVAAHAQEDPWYSGIRSDWGVGNSLGFRGALPGQYSMSRNGTENPAPQQQYGGYRFTESLAIEGSQTSYGLQSGGCSGNNTVSDPRTCYGSALSVAGVASLPILQSGLSVYGRLGLNYWQKGGSQEDLLYSRYADDVGGVLGVGVAYELSRKVTLHAESEHYNELPFGGSQRQNLGLDANVHSIGLSIKF